MHSSTRMTPFFANFGYRSEMQFKLPREIREGAVRVQSERAVDTFAEKLRDAHARLKDNLIVAQERQMRNAGGKEMKFDVGDLMWLATRQIRTTRPSKKLDYKRTGPFKVSQVINDNAYRLDLPSTMRIHNVFHMSLLDRYTPPVEGQHVAPADDR